MKINSENLDLAKDMIVAEFDSLSDVLGDKAVRVIDNEQPLEILSRFLTIVGPDGTPDGTVDENWYWYDYLFASYDDMCEFDEKLTNATTMLLTLGKLLKLELPRSKGHTFKQQYDQVFDTMQEAHDVLVDKDYKEFERTDYQKMLSLGRRQLARVTDLTADEKEILTVFVRQLQQSKKDIESDFVTFHDWLDGALETLRILKVK